VIATLLTESSVPTLTHVIPSLGRKSAAVVTSLGEEEFVMRLGGNLDVYDARKFTLQRHIAIPEVDVAYGLAVCAHYRCVYVSAYFTNSVHRAELSGSSAMKKWSVASDPEGLSVNKAHNVIVTCFEAKKLQEYTTDGSLVREINLQQAGLTCPYHAVELSSGDYVVSQSTSPGGVIVVGVDGKEVCRYQQSQRSAVGQMKNPKSLAVTKNGEILVADARNNRILSINSSLSSAQVLALPGDRRS